MKRLLSLLVILVISAGALYLAQRSKHHDAVTPDAVLDAAAEMERDISRAPMHLTRLSDDSEIRIGNELAEGYLSVEPPCRGSKSSNYLDFLRFLHKCFEADLWSASFFAESQSWLLAEGFTHHAAQEL